MSRLVFALVCASVLPACFYELGELDPKPNLVRAKSTQTIALRLGTEVKDALVLRTKTDAPIKLSHFDDTLWRGFANGPAHFYAPTPRAGASELTLVIHRVDLSVARSKDSELHFEAELLDGKQAVVKTWNDTVRTLIFPKKNYTVDRYTPFVGPAGAAIATLVAAMYDEIDRDLPAR
jgi:hypothetical protein